MYVPFQRKNGMEKMKSVNACDVIVGDVVGYMAYGAFKPFGTVSKISDIDDHIFLKTDSKHFRRLKKTDSILVKN